MGSTPQKAFGRDIECLDSAQLSKNLTEQQAIEIAEMLSISDPWKTLKFSTSTLVNYLMREDPSLRRYGVSDKGTLVGIICIRHPWLRGPYIELLGLFPSARGKGIGKKLIAWAETEARREAKNLWVIASSFNLQALNFYQRLGFYPIGTLQGLVTPEYDEILLRKSLS